MHVLFLWPLFATLCLAEISASDFWDVDEETCSGDEIRNFNRVLNDASALAGHCRYQVQWLEGFRRATGKPNYKDAVLGEDRSRRDRGQNDVNLVYNANAALGLEDVFTRWVEDGARDEPGTQWGYMQEEYKAKLVNARQTLYDLAVYLDPMANANVQKPYLGCDWSVFLPESEYSLNRVREREGKPDVTIRVGEEADFGDGGDLCECGQRGFTTRGAGGVEALILCDGFFDDDWQHELPQGKQDIEGAAEMDNVLAHQRFQAGWLLHQLIHHLAVDREQLFKRTTHASAILILLQVPASES